MLLTKSFKLFFPSLIFCLFFASCSNAQTNKAASSAPAVKKTESNKFNISDFLKKQLLLTNKAQFTKGRNLEGASGFLIKYNGAAFAVTVSHLLGEAGGIEPEIQPKELAKSLMKWEMQPRIVKNAVAETIRLSAEGLDFSQSNADILMLKVISDKFDIAALTPNFELPFAGEKLYLIGCPYSEDNCRQNYYSVEFLGLEENMLIGEIDSSANLSGFSGAPLLNGKGEVVGALVGGGSADGKNYVSATPIREIQKIKF